MLGAMIGDIAGSYYEVLEVEYLKRKEKRPLEERRKILDKNTPLFTDNSSLTDDSILTYAIYKAIKDNSYDYEKYLKDYAKKEIALGKDIYNRSRFGKGFTIWVEGNYQGESYGNGASMRISPVGYMFDTLEEVKLHAKLATIPSHNNEEAIKGAEAVAVAIFLLKTGNKKEQVKAYIEQNYFNLNFDLEELQRNYKFSSRTKNSVPESLFVFFQSPDFESTIRNAISIGGDSDTIACIAGSVAAAYYQIPEKLQNDIKPYLREYMKDIIENHKKYAKSR